MEAIFVIYGLAMFLLFIIFASTGGGKNLDSSKNQELQGIAFLLIGIVFLCALLVAIKINLFAGLGMAGSVAIFGTKKKETEPSSSQLSSPVESSATSSPANEIQQETADTKPLAPEETPDSKRIDSPSGDENSGQQQADEETPDSKQTDSAEAEKQESKEEAPVQKQEPQPVIEELRFNVIFCGELAKGYSSDQVKQNLTALCGQSEEQVEFWFSGKRMVIKKEANYESAMYFQKSFARAGALCAIEPAKRETTGIEGTKD